MKDIKTTPLIISTVNNLRNLLGEYFIDHNEYELNKIFTCTKCNKEVKASNLVKLPTKNTKVFECKSCAAKRKKIWYYQNQDRILLQKQSKKHKPKRTPEQIKKHRNNSRWFFRYSGIVYKLGYKSTKEVPIQIQKELCVSRLVKLHKKNILQRDDALYLLKKISDAQKLNIDILIKSLFTIKVQENNYGTTNTR